MRLPTFQSEDTREILTELTKSTALLNFNSPKIQELILERGWQALSEFERIGAIYDFVRNEIKFGYNESDNIPASQVLADGIGQCNTKGILLMALLRANQIACRFHGFTIYKSLQKGAITGWAYVLAPRSIIHSWVEIWHKDRWINLEGFILDEDYLSALQRRNPSAQRFVGFGAAVTNLSDPRVQWNGSDTYIQKEGINADFGIFNSPDDFYRKHGTNLSGLKKWMFETVVRAQMNRNVERIRKSELEH
ncbi:MAG: transglutaminase-like domain-containing protein [Gammaproteobacteria bacterium]|jgi:transglutaminase-like putative cysteine protease|uniref:transglutaminase-like domain-containing protein n=1 Tax=Rhodoferax sp. TaxID=50421 RepID=UPI001DB4B9A7|nr:transglutaminase-like domain-containing protein [Rhodoferax sp.]MBU3899245.1 transglutaminase-like domain-containing protein [Gammaproteobacteria bacterium]MBU3996477.1 transglutaminase-like domain-containing protein [Gammaproteobacteria bacterium]MBU4082045.1 transglutaminase-like domain-containing protein [Gammaproteobacteria bacterium]MBU4115521.1 transglutaminase-like domain-containing protein [Gammaproteobacteria bacterium]MBU4172752.1 transglutaminase-like domain-containing protein [G